MMVKRSKSFGPTTTTADTKEQIGSTYTLPSGTRKISGLAFAGQHLLAGGLKASSGYITLEIDTVNGPFEFVVSFGSQVFTTSGATSTNPSVAHKDLDIPIPGAGVLQVYITSAEAITDAEVSVEFE